MRYPLMLVVLLLSIDTAESQSVGLSVNAFLTRVESEDRNEREMARSYIHGVGQGIQVANLMIKNRGAEPLYCPPESIDLPDNYIALLKMYAKNQKAPHIRRMLDENGLTPMFLGLALQEAFPCSKYKAR